MGVYLSSPITEKNSSDSEFGKYSYGVSSMQGWRMTQEDSHNCIPDFDAKTETSYFAVYDGHGGAEVAQYCSAKLPNFLKSTLAYKDGQLADALQEAFLGFDGTLRDDQVIKELKTMAGVDDDAEEEDDDGDPVGRTEADMLRAEADIPIEELVAKYGEGMTSIPARKFQKEKDEKFLSPMIKAKRSQANEGATSSGVKSEDNVTDSSTGDTNNSASCSEVADPLVTRLEDKLANGHADNENNLNTEKELREAESVISKTIDDTKKDLKQKPDKDGISSDNIDSCVPDSSELSNNVENVNNSKSVDNSSGSIDTSEADSTSVNDIKHTDISAKSHKEEKSDDESKPSSSSDGSSGSACQPGSSSSGEPSGSSGPSRGVADSEPSGSGDGPSGSGEATSSAGSSGEGSSGSGCGTAGEAKGKTVLDEEYDSDDDSSEDNEYMDDSEEEDEEDDDDDDELDEEEKEQIGGIFSRVITGDDDEEGHIEEPGTDSGCTAVVALLRKNNLVVANAGDSRCVLCRNGKAIDLSVDHKPEDDDERKRIEGAGGKVTADGRVNGGLNLSRAIGDHWYKRNDSILPQEQMISAWPDVQSESIGDEDEFIVIACDGIWNYMTSQEVVDYVRERLQDEEKRKRLSLICEEMFDYCLAPNTMGDGTGCDNMTCIIVLFNYKEQSKTPAKSDCSEADSSTVEETQPTKQLEESSSVETEKKSSSTEMEQKSSSKETEQKSSSTEMEQESNSADTEKKSSSTAMEQESSSVKTEQKSSSAENGEQESSATEKRARESCSSESAADAEAHPEKRARLDEDVVVS